MRFNKYFIVSLISTSIFDYLVYSKNEDYNNVGCSHLTYDLEIITNNSSCLSIAFFRQSNSILDKRNDGDSITYLKR